MKEINNIEDLVALLISRETATLSCNLFISLEPYKNSSNFYIYPINDSESISFITTEIKDSDNKYFISNKTYYKNINGRVKVHREIEPAIYNYNNNGDIESEKWYLEGKNESSDFYLPIHVFYKYNQTVLQEVSFLYSPYKNVIGFRNIEYSVINKEIKSLSFVINGRLVLKEVFFTNKTIEIFSTKFSKLDYLDYYDFTKIKDDLSILRLLTY